ncbi:MAG: hypothetical protein COB15_08705 [Flavobacteriales bacterium]|nr:MAG: hypothetical protein COB15_08705 [Flavobacteriales bacterium]
MKNVISTLVLGLTMIIGINAQTVPSPTELTINLEPLNDIVIPDEVLDTLTDPMNLLSSTDPLILSVSMLLADTNTVAKIHVKLGTTSGSGDLLTTTFTFDNTAPGGDLSYFREEEMMTLGMGTHLNVGVFYCEIVLEDSVGNLSIAENSQSNQ